MKQNFRKHLRPLAVLAAAALLLTGCKGVTEEEKTARENGIALLESGDYEGALDQFEALIQDADRVTDFEVDILKYRAVRLVGLRNSLSRLGGGIGTRGPGEKKLEVDRRLIHERISQLKSELEDVKRHREVVRKKRENGGALTAAIVGYTNAGKSTLLNRLTQAGILAEDKLFATLDPTTRALTLPGGERVLLTDTVGFIRKLPHHLIEAFKSTLEEAKYSDVILHVVDCSNPQMDMQMHVVYETLRQLEITDKEIVTVFNKIDREGADTAGRDMAGVRGSRTFWASWRPSSGAGGSILKRCSPMQRPGGSSGSGKTAASCQRNIRRTGSM